jgi:restriction system protein
VLRLQALQLAQVDQMSGVEFEQYVAALLETRGFNVIVTPQSGDAGVDIVAQRGNDRYAVQAKRYAHHKHLGASAVQEVVTGRIVPKYDCNKTMVVTTAYFGPTAHMLGTLHNCELVDRDTLADWITEFQTVHS